MKQVSVINIEETIGKTVGRRKPGDPLKAADGIQRSLNEAFLQLGHRLTPRGVFRFKTHQEADEWMMRSIRPNKS